MNIRRVSFNHGINHFSIDFSLKNHREGKYYARIDKTEEY